MITIIDKKVYSALLKCNKIGKSLMVKSEYHMLNGMMMAYPMHEDESKYSEYDYGVHIAFIHDKTLKSLEDLAQLPMIIEGDLLYSVDKRSDTKFNRIEITDKLVSIIYDIANLEDDDVIVSKFWVNYMISNPDYEINELSLISELNVIQDYKSFLADYEPEMIMSEYSHDIELMQWGINDKMFQAVTDYSKSILPKLNDDLIMCKILDDEGIADLMSATQPILYEFKFSGNTHKFRLMKALVKGYTKPDNIGMEIKCVPWNIDNMYQNIIVVRQKEFTICSAYKSVLY